MSLGVPCLVGFWGPILVLLGGFAPHPAMALLLALSFVVLAAGHVRVARITLSGPWVDASGAPRTLADARPRELAALVPLILLAVLLGVWPAPLLSQIASGASDASAAAEAAEPAGATP